MAVVKLQCKCGAVSGIARDVSASSGTRITCYCHDCQAFPRHLGIAEKVLDEWGGTDIFQMPQASLQIHEGAQQLRCLRLSEKGMYRWYTNCCQTAIGNTLGPGMPFIGVIHQFMKHEANRDDDLGPSRGNVWVQHALPGAPDSISKAGTAIFLLFRTVRKLAGWKLRGQHQPSAFFTKDGRPVSEPEILSS